MGRRHHHLYYCMENLCSWNHLDSSSRCIHLDTTFHRRCVAAGTGASHFHGAAVRSPTGANGAATALSFMAVIFSFAISWINCAADYNVRMPVNTPRRKIFVATYIGITVPTILVQTLGAAIYSGAQGSAAWKASYVEAGVGGPLKMALEPAGGFGKFDGFGSFKLHSGVCHKMYRHGLLTNDRTHPKQLFLYHARPEFRSLGSPYSSNCPCYLRLRGSHNCRHMRRTILS